MSLKVFQSGVCLVTSVILREREREREREEVSIMMLSSERKLRRSVEIHVLLRLARL